MPLAVTASERLDGTTRWAVADVGLAPLAAGDYVLEVSFAESEKVEVVTYPFRVVPVKRPRLVVAILVSSVIAASAYAQRFRLPEGAFVVIGKVEGTCPGVP